MRSNVCKIDNGTKDLAAILRESEKVAVYNELNHKQTLQLRLLCEEIDGMLPNIIDNFNGNLWIDFEDGVCKVNVSLRFEEFTSDKKDGLVALARNKKNAAATGVVGRIRSAIENILLDEETTWGADVSPESLYYASEYHSRMDYAHSWSLEQYRSSLRGQAKGEDWDELEKSVIASVADDVIVGVKGKQADIIIVKRFA